jgi:CO/xanthine dehydrogenase FAD-binding subunit
LYFRPNTLSEAVNLLAASGGKVLAGGTDVYPSLGDAPLTGTVVDISALRELRGISEDDKYFRIGGLTTWTDITLKLLPRCFDGLKAAAYEIGGVQIQNRGTVAGNLCNASPAADGVPPLLALDAEVELVSQTGTRQLPLTEFLVGNRKTLRQPGEILSQVLVPRSIENAASTFLKFGAREFLVISITMVAVVLQKDRPGLITDARVSVGSCSVVAQRLRLLEQALIGAPAGPRLSMLVTQQHLEDLAPITDVRGPDWFRQHAAWMLLGRAIDACVENL